MRSSNPALSAGIPHQNFIVYSAVMDYVTLLRQVRIGPFAVFDTVLGYLGMLLLSPLLTKLFARFHITIPWDSWLWWMLPISVVFHLLFRQQTPLMQALSHPRGFLIAGLILGFMIFMGARRCKK